MTPYIQPQIGLLNVVAAWFNYRRDAQRVLAEIVEKDNIRALIVRPRARDALAALLIAMGWRARRVGVPGTTCPSLVAAIRASGNIPVLCPMVDFDRFDETAFESEMALGLDALIISDLYGIQVHLPTSLDLSSPARPLLIGDFAHHFRIGGGHDRGLDATIYSTAYYKPIALAGLGICAVISNRIEIGSSADLDYSWWRNLADVAKVLMQKVVLSTHWPASWASVLAWIARRSDGISQEAVPIDVNAKATAVSVALLSKRIVADPDVVMSRVSRYMDAFRDLPAVKIARSSSLGLEGLTFATVVLDSHIDKDLLHRALVARGVLCGRIFWRSASFALSPRPSTQLTHVLNLPLLSCGEIDRVAEQVHAAVAEALG